MTENLSPRNWEPRDREHDVGVVAESAYFGPDTDTVRRMLEEVSAIDEAALVAIYAYSFGDTGSPYRRYKMARDYAWDAFLACVDQNGLGPEFNALWEWAGGRVPDSHDITVALADTVCATMLTSYVDDDGPFTGAHFNTLLAPWRAVVDRDARSMLFLSMAAKWPYPGDELWPIVDAVLLDA